MAESAAACVLIFRSPEPCHRPHYSRGGFTVVSAAPATLTLAYNGKLRDPVGQGNTTLAPDGALDGTLTATLSASGGRTVIGLRLDSDQVGTWDTNAGSIW